MRTYTASAILPVARPPLVPGWITVESPRLGDRPRILALGAGRPAKSAQQGPATDLGPVALIPGLINAHTHLEFSDLRHPLVPRGSFADWIGQVVEHRREHAAPPEIAIRAGIEECRRSGTTRVGEIATSSHSWRQLGSSPLAGIVFRELLGLTGARQQVAREALAEHLAEPEQLGWQGGLSPHAPYTVHPDLLQLAVETAARRRLPLAMHLAETREELELLAAGSGPLREMLDRLAAWDRAALRPGTRPLDLLEILAQAPRSLVIHGNYLDQAELALVAENRERMAVVWCPRTHAHFGHDRYPLEAMLAAGVPVAIGTDSRASNPDLDLWAELQFIATGYPSLPGETILELGTLAGARALGLGDLTGSLEPGKFAELAVVPLADPAARDLYGQLWQAQAEAFAA